MFNRRTYLSLVGTGLATGLAGCSADDADGTDAAATADTGTPSPTFRYTTAGAGELTVTSGPVEAPDLAWTVERRHAATSERPLELRVGLENTGQARELIADGPLPFPPTPGRPTDGEGGGVAPALVPTDADYEARFGGDCWQAPLDDPTLADDAPWDWGDGEARTHTLGSGERLTASYHVVADWPSGCVGRGDYVFARRYDLDGASYEWAFTLHVPARGRLG